MSAIQPIAVPRCHHCGSAEVHEKSHYGSPLCGMCLPIQLHVVSRQTAPGGGSLAVCRCGWRSTVDWRDRHVAQDAKVRAHWNEVLARTGSGARLPELSA